MAECARCGRSSENGATLSTVLGHEEVYCVVCVSWFQEVRSSRPIDQKSLEDYAN